MSQENQRVPFITAIDLYLLIVIGVIKIGASLSSVRLTLWLVDAAAFIAYHLSRVKRRLMEQNLARTFGESLSPNELTPIVKSSFHQFWLEAFSMRSRSLRKVEAIRLTSRGMEHLRHALDNGNGAILWHSGCFGRNVLAKQILHDNGFPVHQVYGENYAGGFYTPCPASWVRRRLINQFFGNSEKPYVAEILNLPLWEPLPVMRTLLERLKKNRIICVAGDGTLGWNWLLKSFLWLERGFSTGMVSLARITGAPILPLFCIQESNDRIVMIIEPPIEMDFTGDRDKMSQTCIEQYVNLLDSYVRKHPGQYYGWHSSDAPGAYAKQVRVTDDLGMQSPVPANVTGASD